jgi:excinuclease ABC subunit A
VCHGKRYNRETLEVRFKGKSIAALLDMTSTGVEFFENVPASCPRSDGCRRWDWDISSSARAPHPLGRVRVAGEARHELAKHERARHSTSSTSPPPACIRGHSILMDVLQEARRRGNTVIFIEPTIESSSWPTTSSTSDLRVGATAAPCWPRAQPSRWQRARKAIRRKYIKDNAGRH